jgi:hypothetical protein
MSKKTPNKKTSLSINPNLWKEWTKFVIDKTGSARKLSEEAEHALTEYMDSHKNKEGSS